MSIENEDSSGDNFQPKQKSTRERLLDFLWFVRLAIYCPVLCFVAGLLCGLSPPTLLLLMAVLSILLGLSFARPEARLRLAQLRSRRLPRLLDRGAGILLGVLLATELALSLAARLSPSPLLQKAGQGAAQEVASHKLPKGQLFFGKLINEHGYYDDPIPTRRDPQRFRVAAIGDSFAVGVVPHHQNFLTLLERAPNQGRRGIDVINLGVCAIGPFEYRWLWDNEARLLAPDVLLLSVFVGNDLFIALRDSSRWERDGWYSWLVATRLLSLSQKAAQVAPGSGELPLEASIRRFSPEAYRELVRAKSIVFRKTLKERHERRIQAALEAIDGILRVAPCPVLLLVIPDELQVNVSLQQDIFAAPDFNRSDFDLEGPNRRLAALASAHPNVRLVDPLQALREADLQAPTYALRDTHWNDRGNAIVAAQIAPVLEEVLSKIKTGAQ